VVTNKDLVEADAFDRRRLVQSFVSGTSARRRSGSVSPGRIIVVGVLLAVLLLAGAAVTRYVAWPAAHVRPAAQPAGEGR
jgi:hypothetical protein